MAEVVVENVYKSYSRRKSGDRDSAQNDALSPITSQGVSVLRDINFTVQDGEFLVLVGPSGCGKSTLLRLIAGLEELTGGNIYIGDCLVNQLPPKARDIAMVFQNYALYPHLNIYDNLAFGLRRNDQLAEQSLIQNYLQTGFVKLTRNFPRSLRYLSSKEKTVRERVRYVASLLQIEALLRRFPKELSGGQKQRVALGRAIARNPQVFLMDEPLSNLDAKLRTQTRGQIVQLQRQLQTTTVYVTHDQTEAMTMGDRIAVMYQGQIQQIAPPLEIYQRPANQFVAEFIGSPPMNFFSVEYAPPGKLISPHFVLELAEPWRSQLCSTSPSSLILGVRPQHLKIKTKDEAQFQIEVDLVEALGNETYISAHLVAHPTTTLTITLPPEQSLAIGERSWVAMTQAKIHLFAAENGQALSAQKQLV